MSLGWIFIVLKGRVCVLFFDVVVCGFAFYLFDFLGRDLGLEFLGNNLGMMQSI